MSRRNRTLIVVGLAILTASLASWGVYRAVLNRPAAIAATGMGQLVVANRLLPAGSVLRADDVRVATWPADSMVPGSFQRIEDVVGRGVRTSIQENEPVSNNRLAGSGEGRGLALLIPDGMVASTVRVNDIVGVAGFLTPGSRVNVLATVEDFTGTVLRDIEVVATGTETEQSPMPGAEATTQASTVTLLVTEEDSEKLAMAQNRGSIVLALRPAASSIVAETNGVRLSNLFSGTAPPPPVNPAPRRPRATTPPPAPPPPPPGPPKINVITGTDSREVVVGGGAGRSGGSGGRGGGGGGGQ